MGLRPKRSLLNHNFQGYRLAADVSTAVSSSELCVLPLNRTLGEDLFSFHLVRVFGTWNHLFADPWCSDRAYFITDGFKVCRCSTKNDGPLNEVVLSLSETADCPSTNPLPASVVFTSDSTAVLTDGQGVLYVVFTGPRHSTSTVSHPWNVRASYKECHPFTVLTAQKSNSENVWDCVLLLYEVLEKAPTETASSKGKAHQQQCAFTLSWLQLKLSDDHLGVEPVVSLSGSSVPFYCSLEKEAASLLLLAEGSFRKVGSSNGSTESGDSPAAEAGAGMDGVAEKQSLQWTQTSDDVTIVFDVDEDVRVRDVAYHLQKDEVTLGLTDGTTLLRGKLFGLVDREGSAWTLEKGRLELSLEKYQPGQQWSSVLQDGNIANEGFNPRPLEGLSEAEAKAISERLEQFTSDKLMTDSDLPHRRSVLHQELEECDNSPEGERMLLRFSRTGRLTHQTNVSSNEWLFNGLHQQHNVRTICLRHDVDACLWQPAPFSSTADDTRVRLVQCEHVATFNALGYVQASKQNRKFIACPNDCSYTVVCECARNVFVYYSDACHGSSDYALQSVFTLPQTKVGADSTVLGILPMPNRQIFILTEERVLLLSIKS